MNETDPDILCAFLRLADKERRLFFLAWGQVRVLYAPYLVRYAPYLVLYAPYLVLCAPYLVLYAPYLVLCAPYLGCRIIVLDAERTFSIRVSGFRVQEMGPSAQGLVFRIGFRV